MKKSFPVKLSPAYKDYLWGGERLKTVFRKESDLTPRAESWELALHPDGECTVASGDSRGLSFGAYLDWLGKEALGTAAAGLDRFPLLVKLIDASQDLSVQVHPADAYALREEGELGKTEMWYILEAEEGASLYYGFRRPVTREEYARAVEEERLTELLLRVPVKRGDCFFIEAGTVHAIGGGILLCEVQQNSNLTYRVFDYGRRDKAGNLRPLHTARALEVSSLAPAPAVCEVPEGEDVLLATCPYFTCRRLRPAGECRVPLDKTSFRSLLVTRGEGELSLAGEGLSLSMGDSVFIPAQEGAFTLCGDLEVILTHL